MAKLDRTDYDVVTFATHPLYDTNDAFSRHFLEVYKHKAAKTLLCPDCTANASYKTWAHLRQHYTTCKGPTITAAGPFARLALEQGQNCAEFIDVYRKLVAATPGKGQMVSFSVMLTQMQERLIKKMQSEHDRTVTFLNARADTRHNESKAMIERQARMIKELQVSVSKFALESETRDSAIMTGVANVSAQVANVSAQVALVDTELTALKRAAVELQPLACNQCTFVCTPEQYKQSADIIEGVRWWGCAMCKTSQVDERVPSETAAAELRVNGTVECWQVTPCLITNSMLTVCESGQIGNTSVDKECNICYSKYGVSEGDAHAISGCEFSFARKWF